MNLLNRADSYTEFLQHNRVANGGPYHAGRRRGRKVPTEVATAARTLRRRAAAAEADGGADVNRRASIPPSSTAGAPRQLRAHSYSVQQMTREMGIRMALGVEANEGRNMVVVQGMRLSLAGILIGLAAAFGLSRLIRSLLFGVTASDPAVFVIVPIVSGIFALLAVWVPAQRATRI